MSRALHHRCKSLPLARAVAAAVSFSATLPHAAGIVPDGTTATTVSTSASGRQSVVPAPPTGGGVSYNAYRDFSVGKPGADFVNSGANARVIVNEVTSTNPSLIEGEVAIVGPRAHFILANPNGITVNGGRFVNTGTLALATGKVSLLDFQPAPGIWQRNVVLDTSIGAIEIGPDGLAGSFASLELVAKRIKVGGPVENSFTNGNARLRMVAGDSHAEFDSSVSPTDNLTSFVRYSAPAASGQGTIAVDITPLGSLSAGRIELIVTDRGAGVRHAGNALASAGDFVVATTGEVTLHGGSVMAARDLRIAAASLTAENDPLRQGSALVAAGGAVTITTTGDLVNRGSLIQGAAISAADAASLGAVTLEVAGSLRNESQDPTRLAAIFGGGGDVVIHAAGDLTNRAGRMVSTQRLDIRAGGDLVNMIDSAVGGNAGTRADFRTSHTELLFLTRSRSGFDVDYGSLPVTGQAAYLVAEGDVSLAGRNVVNRGGEIYANGGSVRVAAVERFTNEALASGNAHFERKCLIVCKSSASSDVAIRGGLVSAAQDVSIDAGTEASNTGGRVLALGDMTITAPKVFARGITGYTTLERERGLRAWFGDTWAQVYAADVGGSYTASRGRLTVNGTLVVDGAEAAGGAGTDVTGGTVMVRARRADPLRVSEHSGLTSWIGY